MKPLLCGEEEGGGVAPIGGNPEIATMEATAGAVQALLRSGELGSKVREEKHSDGQHKPEKAI